MMIWVVLNSLIQMYHRVRILYLENRGNVSFIFQICFIDSSHVEFAQHGELEWKWYQARLIHVWTYTLLIKHFEYLNKIASENISQRIGSNFSSEICSFKNHAVECRFTQRSYISTFNNCWLYVVWLKNISWGLSLVNLTSYTGETFLHFTPVRYLFSNTAKQPPKTKKNSHTHKKKKKKQVNPIKQ